MKLLFLIIIFFSYPRAFAEVVCSQKINNPVLVILDMQNFFVTKNIIGPEISSEGLQKVEALLQAQIEAIRQAKKKDIPILFIEYYHPKVNTGETSERLKNEVKNYSNAKFMKKTKDGIFDPENENKAELIKYLQKHEIGTLVLAGANGSACVEKSIQGALDINCNVVAYTEAIADFNYPDFIYPYTGSYGNMTTKNCKDCTFEEVSHIDGVKKAFIANPKKQAQSSNQKLRDENLGAGAR